MHIAPTFVDAHMQHNRYPCYTIHECIESEMNEPNFNYELWDWLL